MRNHFIYIFFTAIPFTVLFLQGCQHAPPDKCANPVSYTNDIVPIVTNHCAISGCHVAGFQPGNFTSYDTLKEKADDGTLQLLVVEVKTMPPSGSITQSQRDIIECWILQGALNN